VDINMLEDFSNITNLCYLIRGDEVLLIMKKRGLGVGKWNGPGGKVQGDETIEQATTREVEEETGYLATALDSVGFIEFIWPPEKEKYNQRCHIYLCHKFSGELKETEECLPQWFKINQIPLDQMWPADRCWFPEVLAGKSVKKRFFYNNNIEIEKMEEIK
jgi:8-oxo-dGTP pyrophosphatase MutT (NUDIX family)